MTNTLTPIERALLILNKDGADCQSADIIALSKELKQIKAFGYARRILALGMKINNLPRAEMLLITQQCALCTYKDVDLPAATRFDLAIDILEDPNPDLHHTKNQETLGIAGAIYKRKWDTDGQINHLEQSLSYYQKGYEQGITGDNGYTAINTAFVLDLLIQNSTSSNSVTGGAVQTQMVTFWKDKATSIRNEIITTLTAGLTNKTITADWWVLATIAEAFFGLMRYEDARPWLQQAMKMPGVADWEKEATTRQLARISLIHENGKLGSSAWEVLKELIDNDEEDIGALESAFSGKIGLALSGGGFRASLYHIGVLAKLAELDVLRRVEVLSCVSGGSIIGAHYYLEVRHLLQTKADLEITTEDYIDIVQRISRDFLDGVQRNLRTRVIGNWYYSFKMLLSGTYTRTNRIGELYERELFSKVKDGDHDKIRWLNHLYIHPMQEDGEQKLDFNPKYDNWRRKSKVPILILNATTLNTGHNWQFTASWMGESPAAVQKIDGNYRLRRTYYKTDGGPDAQRVMRFGYAVAASSCVPGMFEPLALPHLYEGKVVRLVDGGVHDNQGICGLLEQDCDVMLVSDASGQMGAIDKPGSDVLSVPLRANDILMERVRNAEYQDMNRRSTAGLLKGFMFIHLKMGLDVSLVDWINCEDPAEQNPSQHTLARITAYNIRKDIQQKLAAVRTDLDSFNDTEAFALMTSGYQMVASEFPKCVKNFGAQKVENVEWNFLDIDHDLQRPDVPDKVMALLDVAKERTFKIWKISKPLNILSKVLAFAGVIGLIYLGWEFRKHSLISVGSLGITVLFFVLGLFISKTIIKIIRYRETMIRFASGLGVITLGWIVAHIHLAIFDKMYLRAGRRKRDNTLYTKKSGPQGPAGNNPGSNGLKIDLAPSGGPSQPVVEVAQTLSGDTI